MILEIPNLENNQTQMGGDMLIAKCFMEDMGLEQLKQFNP